MVLLLFRMPRPVALMVALSAVSVLPLNSVIAGRRGEPSLLASLPARITREAPLRTFQSSAGAPSSTTACASGPSRSAANAAGTEQLSNSKQAQLCLRLRNLIGVFISSPESESSNERLSFEMAG
ncbi:hypothetical protein D3C80_1719570 [compost metagenome]